MRYVHSYIVTDCTAGHLLLIVQCLYDVRYINACQQSAVKIDVNFVDILSRKETESLISSAPAYSRSISAFAGRSNWASSTSKNVAAANGSNPAISPMSLEYST